MKRFICLLLCLMLLMALFISASYAEDGKQTVIPLGTTAAPYGYYEYLPQGYGVDTAKKWPVVIFLHGSGERGNGTSQLSLVLKNGPPKNINNGTQYPFICISPQSPVWWEVNTIDKMVEYIKSAYRVDPDRIYLTGLSMGGGGTWSYAVTFPQKLAAIVPVCGAGTPFKEQSLIDLPVWAFHSWGDTTVSSSDSVDWCNKIAGAILKTAPTDMIANYPGIYTALPGKGSRADKTRTANFNEQTGWTWVDEISNITGSHPALTLYPDTSHDSWTRTYSDQKMWNWLLSQKRSAVRLKPPLAKVASPINGASFNEPANILIKSEASDPDGSIIKVEFYNGSVRLGEDITAPYECEWKNIMEGTYSISIKVTDNDGLTTNSANVNISVKRPPEGSGELRVINPFAAGASTGGSYFPMEFAFDGPPVLDEVASEPIGGGGIKDSPYYAGRYGYIDFGPEWSNVKITATWTKYRTWSRGDQTPYTELWWDDDKDTINDSRLVEPAINFNTAKGLNTQTEEKWICDFDAGGSYVIPKARYLICHASSNMTNRAREYAIIGYTN